MTEWRFLIFFAIDLMVSAICITYSSGLLGLAKDMGRIQEDRQANIERLNEYREFNKYDGTTIYAQDVISAILQYRGYPEIVVSFKSGTTISYNSNTNSSDYVTSVISDQFKDKSAKFKSTKSNDLNGCLNKITVVEQ